MKKFLLYLLVLVFMVSFVGLIFYLTRPDETISADSETVYLNVGEESTPSYLVENKKNSTKIEITSSNEDVAKIDGEKILAKSKGLAVVSITLTNAKGKTQVIQEKVFVGDGSSSEFPIFIRNEADLKNIGVKYAKDLFFRQTANITLNSEMSTIAGEFSGQYDGDNHKILNYFQTGEKDSTALFDVITGTVGLLTFENVDINGSFAKASVLANTNKGLIDYIEVIGKIKNTNETGLCAGVVINNQDGAQIQRCVTKLNIISSGKVIAGIAVYNNAIITSCQNGDTSLKNPVNSDFEFISLDGAVAGGIVAKNECLDEVVNDQTVAKTIVSNSFSVNQIKSQTDEVYNFNGSTWVKLTQSADNNILYLDASANEFIINKTATENKYFLDVNKNGVYDEEIDSNLSIWDSASAPTNLSIKFSHNCFLGGIIGVDFAHNETPVEIESRKTANIFGNYYLIIADYDLVKRGVGNVSSTTPTSTGNMYVANGLTYVTVTSPDSIFVSYVISFNVSGEQINKLKSWPANVWVLDSSYFPYLISQEQAVDKLTRLAIDLPVISVSEDQIIDSANKFILYARTGVFTNPENAGKTYHIVKDLDFSGLDFVVVGSEERPVVVNFEGTGCTLSNIAITSSTKYIAISDLSTIGESKPESIGIFGVVSGSTFDSFNLKNCTINTIGDIEGSKNIGGIAGKTVNATLSECSFMADVDDSGAYMSSISSPSTAENVGALVGLMNGSSISNAMTEIEIACLNALSHEGKLYIGGLVGKLDENGTNNINFSKFNGKITANINTNVYSGGAAGFVASSSTINSFSGRGVNITSAFAGGIVAVVKGSILNSSIRDTLNTKNGGGFAFSVEDNAKISNCYCETTFTLASAEVNAGMASQVSSTCHFTNCVNLNNFNNEATASKNYSRTKQNVKFEFDCGGKITELNQYGSGYDISEVIMTNCFYVNRVNGGDSNDYNLTTFYSQTNNGVSGVFGANRVDAKAVLTTWYNGSVRNGRLKAAGGLAEGPDTSVTWTDFGFSSNIWNNAGSGIMSATLYIA